VVFTPVSTQISNVKATGLVYRVNKPIHLHLTLAPLLLLGEPIRQATVCDGIRPHFCYAYWFFKDNKLKSNRTSGRGYVRYALPFALPINLTLYNCSEGLSNRATGRAYVYCMPFLLL
jgi:hypothetical protein